MSSYIYFVQRYNIIKQFKYSKVLIILYLIHYLIVTPYFVSDAHIRSKRDFSQGSAKRRKIQLQSMIK